MENKKDWQDLENYDDQTSRHMAQLARASEVKQRSKLQKPNAEVTLHHVASIQAAAAILNGQGSVHDLIGGINAMGEISGAFPILLDQARKMHRLLKNPGNHQQIDKILNVADGTPLAGMSTAQAMNQIKARIGGFSASGSY